MELVLLNRDSTKKQQEILNIMTEEKILSPEAEDGICFTLTLHTIEKYIRNLTPENQAKRETFPIKYEKVFNHCMKSDNKYKKHCKDLIDEFNKYHAHYVSGKGQADVIRDTIADCGFADSLNNIRIEEHKIADDAAADLVSALENNENVALLLCINAANEMGRAVGHTVALVRNVSNIYFLDVSNYIIEAAIADGSTEKKKYSTSEFINEKILVDLKKREILNVTYAVIIP